MSKLKQAKISESYIYKASFIYICKSLTYRKTRQNNVNLYLQIQNIIEIKENKMKPNEIETNNANKTKEEKNCLVVKIYSSWIIIILKTLY